MEEKSEKKIYRKCENIVNNYKKRKKFTRKYVYTEINLLFKLKCCYE